MNNIDFQINRRSFLNRSGAGIGSVALASMLNDEIRAENKPSDKWTGVIQKPHLPIKAKRVIHLCMAGGPSHLETLDYKPELAKMNGKPMPQSFTKGQPIAQLQGNKNLTCLGPQHEFKNYGKSGQYISSIFPEIGSVADDIAVVRSMVTEQINHDPAHTFMNTGTQISGRPSMGSWLLYGLGAETENLPGYVVLTSVGGGQNQPIAARQWHSGFLPSRFQGVPFHSKGDPVLYVSNPKGVNRQDQRTVVDSVNALNSIHNDQVADPEISARIAQYELAFKMQASVPGLMDVSKEPQHVLDMYGAKPGDGSFASNCLLARRLAERGVRFIQLYHRGWDHHGGIKNASKNTAGLVDKGSAALIKDLKERGMLDDTLVIWGGEFGRTPMAQGNGRDHHIKGFSLWMAGGGIKGGVSHGATDELGYNSVTDIVNVRDLHATLLHLFGIDYRKFSYQFQGLDFRLTGVKPANVIKPILA
ncbi:MAG: sulfatase [Verrucomicrobiales bacterium]|nr:sulfatase [Verrucomicrobiales bacterium]MBV62954.1 sulfatase [Rickettsiales bacterium]|tara:strand:- start:708 stop:2132 length:1425 start_codon:yes stop_codon:yes gene_type:complete